MKIINESAVVLHKFNVLAQTYHLHHGDRKIQAVRVYRVYRDPQGGVCTEWLLTRFQDKNGKAYSALHMVCRGGREEYLSEYFSCERKQEKTMIDKWMAFVQEDE